MTSEWRQNEAGLTGMSLCDLCESMAIATAFLLDIIFDLKFGDYLSLWDELVTCPGCARLLSKESWDRLDGWMSNPSQKNKTEQNKTGI